MEARRGKTINLEKKNLSGLLRLSARLNTDAELRGRILSRVMEIISNSSQEELKIELKKLLLKKAGCTEKHFIENIDSNAIRGILREIRSLLGLDYSPLTDISRNGGARDLSEQEKMELFRLQSSIAGTMFRFNTQMGEVISSLKNSCSRKSINKT